MAARWSKSRWTKCSSTRRIASLPGAARRRWATEIKNRLREQIGLPCTIGIASNSSSPKIASTVGKPDGLIEVPAGDEARFLARCPSAIVGRGQKGAAKLQALGIYSIGDLQNAPLARLQQEFGDWRSICNSGRARRPATWSKTDSRAKIHQP